MFRFLFGVLFVGVGGLSLILFAKITTLECDRLEPKQIECTLVSEGVLGTNTTLIPPGHLQGAKVQVSEDSDSNDIYRVVLRTETGNVPFSAVYSSGRSGKQQKAEQINAYLNNVNQKVLTIQQDDRIFGYVFGGIFGLSGVAMMGSSLLSRH
ncbi:MAG: hypothetical protein F6K30_10940 [Cyanothece sp. SIO2G6]|nr:hypothetical protein [Cyanothece sp. SIO2G6]